MRRVWGSFLFASLGALGCRSPTQTPAVDASVLELSAGRAVGCGRFDDGTVRCWGQNGYDVLGQGEGAIPLDAASSAPLVVHGLSNPAQLCVASTHACVVDTSHALRCWGENDNGALGPVDAGDHAATPVLVGLDPHVSKVVCGDDTACALFDDAGTLCWGYDIFGELGVPNPPGSTLAPTAIPNLSAARDIFAGGYGQCAILALGGVACWGNDANLQLGAGTGLGDMPLGAYPVVF